ncbi:hypothetical protein ABMA27_012526 [Loxostege sticticalis]|uniref:BED-type domain-containing protein n=1 Tax=Loxostege sticticalis TaxID=481309 RepID=A0ABR3GZC6_LOXSC
MDDDRKHGDCVDPITKVSDDEEGSIEALETYLEDDVEEVEDEQPIDKRKLLRNVAWEYFEIHDEEEKLAVCTLCKEQFSYRTTSSNLAKHLRRKHYSEIEDNEFLNNLDDDEKSPAKRKSSYGCGRMSKAWEYFTVKDAKKRIASCKICDTDCSFLSSVSNLMKHVRRKHGVGEDSDDEHKPDPHPKRSPIWLYFKCIDEVAKISVCLICKQQLSHLTSTSNLKRHLIRKHPGIKLRDTADGKKMLISSDGQLYEIDETGKTEVLDVDDDDQNEPMELNAIYLDDYEGKIIEPKRNRKSSTSKRKRLLLSENESSDEEITFQKRYVKKKSDSLDQFGKYLVSLLKQLPKELSNQLQADFVKQVMTAQLSYESQKVVVTPSNGYAITITETRPDDVSNDGQSVQYVTSEAENINHNVSS